MIRRFGLALLLLVAAACSSIGAGEEGAVQFRDAALSDSDGRAVPVRLVWRPGRRDAPLVAFSHGANSEPARYDRLTAALAARGYVVVAPLHADSPWHPGGGKIDPATSWARRVADMRLALASDGAIEATTGTGVRAGSAAAAGHSYGALVAQALGGARVQRPGVARDQRVRAVLAWSPPGEIAGFVDRAGWSEIATPMLVVTGDADILPPIAPRWEAHLASWEASPKPKLLLAGRGVDHYFGNLIGRPERPAPPPHVVDAFYVSVQVAGDVLDARLRDDARATNRLRDLDRLAPALFVRAESSGG